MNSSRLKENMRCTILNLKWNRTPRDGVITRGFVT